MVKSKGGVKLQKVNVLSVANIAALIYLVLAPVYFLVALANEYTLTGVIELTLLEGLTRLVALLIILPISAWVGVSIVSLL